MSKEKYQGSGVFFLLSFRSFLPFSILMFIKVHAIFPKHPRGLVCRLHTDPEIVSNL